MSIGVSFGFGCVETRRRQRFVCVQRHDLSGRIEYMYFYHHNSRVEIMLIFLLLLVFIGIRFFRSILSLHLFLLLLFRWCAAFGMVVAAAAVIIVFSVLLWLVCTHKIQHSNDDHM